MEGSLPIQGEHQHMLAYYVISLARSYVESIGMELGGIHGNITLCPLGYEDNHLMRTMVNHTFPH